MYLFPLIIILLVGCASLGESGQLPEVAERQPPSVHFGSELLLLDNPPKISSGFAVNEDASTLFSGTMFGTGLVSKDGRAHLFPIDAKGLIHHIEIQDDKILTREVLGKVNVYSDLSAMDAIELPSGQLRVLIGDSQYARVLPDQPWHEFKGNRCKRFVPVAAELFCAFVISGKEASAPQRTDVSAGWFLLIPVVWWSNEQASKLVLAQESHGNWTIRAVIDPTDIRNADPDFVVEADNQDVIHLLYSSSRSNVFFTVLVGPQGGGSEIWGVDPELRYAEIGLEQLLTSSRSPLRNGPVSSDWISINSTIMPLLPPPMQKAWGGVHNIPWNILTPLNRHFDLNKATGEMAGIVWPPGEMTLQKGNKRLDILPDRDNLWLEVDINKTGWEPDIDIVAAGDLPDSTYQFSRYTPFVIKHDEVGNSHVLSSHCVARCFIDYFKKSNGKWSAPITIGMVGKENKTMIPLLLIGSPSNVFATWINENEKLVGKWIKQ